MQHIENHHLRRDKTVPAERSYVRWHVLVGGWVCVCVCAHARKMQAFTRNGYFRWTTRTTSGFFFHVYSGSVAFVYSMVVDVLVPGSGYGIVVDRRRLCTKCAGWCRRMLASFCSAHRGGMGEQDADFGTSLVYIYNHIYKDSR